MPLVAEVIDAVIDAVIDGDTHRDTHALEMTAPTGATISTLAIDDDEMASLTRGPGSARPEDRGSRGRILSAATVQTTSHPARGPGGLVGRLVAQRI